jgi:hypothetical protein
VVSLTAFAQENQIEGGLLLGSSMFLGEMGNSSKEGRPFIADLQWELTGGNIGVYGRYFYKPWLAFRANLQYGRVAGSDSTSDNFGRRLRNLHFKSHIIELSGIAEFRLLRLPRYRGFKNVAKMASVNKRLGHLQPEFTLFAFAGLGAFHFNPRAQYEGKWYSLQPMGTEGQGIIPGKKKYNRIQVSIPMGLEVFFTTNPNLYRIGLEIGYRYTFTDYIDDISTEYADPAQITAVRGPVAGALSNRSIEFTNDANILGNTAPGQMKGDPSDNDTYVFTNFSFTYVIRTMKHTPKYNRDTTD